MSEEVHDAVLHVATDAGVRRVQVHESPDYRFATISVDMGIPSPGSAIPAPVAEVMEGRFGTVDMGNPHLVVLVDDPTVVDVATQGSWLEEQFQGGINVEFVAVGPDPDQLTLRVWERGSGVTEACGTGACAAAHLARAWGLVGDRVGVHMPGGHAEVVFDGDHVTLIGPASHVATVELPDA
jgi:diaminopimelate epimerase